MRHYGALFISQKGNGLILALIAEHGLDVICVYSIREFSDLLWLVTQTLDRELCVYYREYMIVVQCKGFISVGLELQPVEVLPLGRYLTHHSEKIKSE